MNLEITAREWLRAMDIPALSDFLKRGGSTHCRSYHSSLLQAVNEGRVAYETALANAPNPTEFSRSIRGIS